MAKLLFLCALFYIFHLFVQADRTSNKIYINLSENIPCFRRLNATHQTGCASHRGGSVGILQYIQTITDLQVLLLNGTNYPFIIVIKPQYFSRLALDDMRKSGKVSGVLLLYLKNETLSDIDHQFSPDQKCPNMNYGMYREKYQDKACSVKWNKDGNNALFEDWGFPIFVIREEKDANNLLECYKTFNGPDSEQSNEWPYCAAELKSNMLAAKDTKTCMRRSHLVTNLNPIVICDPIGDANIWSTLRPTNKNVPLDPQSLIVVAARLDAASQFDGFSPGAHTTVTGLVTLLAVADALAKMKQNFTSNMNVMFILFNGEAFDYIGSSRMVYEMENNIFPLPYSDEFTQQPPLINISHIKHFIEISQLSRDPNETIFMHTDPVSSAVNDTRKENVKTRKQLKIQAQLYNISAKLAEDQQPLPPSSIQSFLRKMNISGMVIADHESAYRNKYYNSVFDVAKTLNVSFDKNSTSKDTQSLQKYLTKVASAIAGTVYYLAMDESSVKIEANETLINDLLLCYINNSNCVFFKELVDPQQAKILPDEPYPLYVSVGDSFINPVTVMTLKSLGRLTGELMANVSRGNCQQNKTDQVFRYFWMQSSENSTGVCVKTTANYSKAVSPAFEIDDYDFDSGLYSTWTESRWEPMSVRIFLKPSVMWESFVLSMGIIICLLSFVVVWFIDRNTDCLFVQDQVIC